MNYSHLTDSELCRHITDGTPLEMELRDRLEALVAQIDQLPDIEALEEEIAISREIKIQMENEISELQKENDKLQEENDALKAMIKREEYDR
jgi:chromosome segregation ATPase